MHFGWPCRRQGSAVVCANVRRDQRLLSRCGEVRESLGKEAQQRAARDEAGGGGAGWRFRATPLPLLAFSGECLSGGAVARGCRSRAALGAGVTTGKCFESFTTEQSRCWGCALGGALGTKEGGGRRGQGPQSGAPPCRLRGGPGGTGR